MRPTLLAIHQAGSQAEYAVVASCSAFGSNRPSKSHPPNRVGEGSRKSVRSNLRLGRYQLQKHHNKSQRQDGEN